MELWVTGGWSAIRRLAKNAVLGNSSSLVAKCLSTKLRPVNAAALLETNPTKFRQSPAPKCTSEVSALTKHLTLYRKYPTPVVCPTM